jgi:hypothetical protein
MTLGIGFKYVISISVLIVVLLTEPLYHQPLFDKSFTYIPRIQEGASSALKGFWGVYTDLGLNLVTLGPTLICFLMTDQRVRAMYYITVLAAFFLLMNTSKLTYADPRPFWLGRGVQAFHCSG